jgi:ABC-type nitrate/sulfonate/bicarbonate transport system substrate-binding protein
VPSHLTLPLRALVTILCCGLVGVVACGSPQSASPAPKPAAAQPAAARPAVPAQAAASVPTPVLDVVISSPAQSLNFLVVDVAVAEGFYAREGLNVQHVMMSSNAAIAALMSGEVDMTTSTGSLARAIPTGVPAKVLLYMVGAPNHSMYVHPSIREMRDLVGKPFGIESPVSDVRVIADTMFRAHGIDPADVTFLAVGAERLAALMSGSIMGTLLAPPEDVLAEREGFVRLARGRDHVQMPMAGLGTNIKYTQDEREKLRRVFRGTLKALDYVRDNRPAVVEFIGAKFGMDREQAERAYDSMVWTTNGEVSSENVKGVLEFIERAGNLNRSVPVDEVVDYAFLREVRAEMGR